MQPENSQKTAKKRAATKASFKPGQCGNPGGRPKRTQEEFELIAACKEKAPAALKTIESLMLTAKQDSVRLSAALSIVERAYGKPTERKEVRTGPLEGLGHDDLVTLNDALETVTGQAGLHVAAGTNSTRH